MTYVQGTTVKIEADFTNTATGTAFAPTEVIVDVLPAGATTPTQYKLSLTQVTPDPIVTGRYSVLIDTSSTPGTWWYQFTADDTTDTVTRQSFYVQPNIETSR